MQNNTFSTLFVGQNRINLLAVDSTNNFLKELLSKSEPLPEGTVIMAEDQYAGRGQQQNNWQAEAGKNLTFSILLKPNFLPLNKQFLLNMAISVGINNALKCYLSANIYIKWPNDIYYQDKKLGGVLIENSIFGETIKNSVIGIGLNVNQAIFYSDLSDKATSLYQILQEDVNLIELLAEICSQIESLYLQLRTGNYTHLKKCYVDRLYLIHKPALFSQNGEIFEGIIRGVSEIGLLKIERAKRIESYNFKEIEFLKTNTK